MIKPKTKAQKQQDQNKLEQAAHECAKIINSFIRELFESDFRLDWIYVSTINKMQQANENYLFAKKNAKRRIYFY